MAVAVPPSISEPTLLATHASSSASTSSAPLAGSVLKLDEALASGAEVSDAPRRVRGAAAWCAAGEIRIAETETTAPLSTHLLGPLRPHAAAPFVTLGPEANQRTTFLGADDASGSSSLHAWVEEGIARTGQTGEKPARREKLELRHSASAINVVSSTLVISHPNGAVSLATLPKASTPWQATFVEPPTQGLSVKPIVLLAGRAGREVKPSLGAAGLLFSISSAAPSTGAPSSGRKTRKSATSAAASANAESASATLLVQEIAPAPRPSVKVVVELALGVEAAEVAAVCVGGTLVSVLTNDGVLTQYTLSLSPPALEAPTTLRLLTAPTSPALLSLNSQGTLLLHSSASLLLISPQHGSILASTPVTLPSSLAGAKPSAASLSRIGAGALLALTLGKSQVVFAVPVEAPAPSIRWALASKELTKSLLTAPGAAVGGDAQDAQESQLPHAGLEAVRAASGAREREAAWLAWVEKETARCKAQFDEEERKRKEAADADKAQASGSDSEADAPQASERAASKHTAWRRDPPKPSLTHSLSTALLALSLPAPTQSGAADPKAPFARRIVQYLINRRAISSSMLPNGSASLIARLLAQGDWESSLLATRLVPDVPEADLVKLLTIALRTPQAEGAVRNGPLPQPCPGLPHVLSALAGSPASRPLFRNALKASIGDADEVCRVLLLLDDWLRARALTPIFIAGATELVGATDADQGAAIDKAARSQAKRGRKERGTEGVVIPPLDQIITLLIDLLDTYFPLLLQTPTTYPALGRLSRSLSTHLAACSQLTSLRGPLAAFAKLEADQKERAAREVAERALRRARGGREARQAKHTAAVGLSETGGGLGKRQAPVSIRAKEYEASALVGPYSIERLAI